MKTAEKNKTALDLSPARWIWFPSARTLANTFVLFRRELHLASAPVSARGWISADSRYRLTLNGQRVQWGPAPSDPRWPEADPIDLTSRLQSGKNVLGVEVLFYGHGDGTWPMGKPGLLLNVEINFSDGAKPRVLSDESWWCFLDRAHRPGQYRRWYLRALQEEFDARLHPFDWDTPQFQPDARWLPAQLLSGRADKPALAVSDPEYSSEMGLLDIEAAQIRPRSIPLLLEYHVPAKRLVASGKVCWRRDPLDWFEYRTPNSFELTREPVAVPTSDGEWTLPATSDSSQGVYATFEFDEQLVGWPQLTVDAPAGTVIELITQEAHDENKTAWLDTQFFCWSRFICREGINHLEPFDFESFRWLQIHVRGANRPVKVSSVGARRRRFDWPHEPRIECGDRALQKLFSASINTLHNCAQETCGDGMARERQQYSGDGSHQLHAIRYTFGETRLPARFLATFSQGLTLDGYFLDCWPAYDRLARLAQRQMGASIWGPLLDHGVGFVFDCWNHYWETGDRQALVEPYPRLLRFADYLTKLRSDDGLLPVENLGVPTVYVDHQAYLQQRHKQCAFNLYAAAMLTHALAPMAELFGEAQRAADSRRFGAELLAKCVQRFWDSGRAVFVNNLPWLGEEREPRLCDRSLATAVLFDQCPRHDTRAALKILAECPPEMGFSYPANAVWRLWALAKGGYGEAVLRDLRERWATMRSVIENNTLQEFWTAATDGIEQWSHSATAPLNLLFMDIAGIRPLAPGFEKVAIRPQLGDLPALALTAHTVRGAIHFEAQPETDGHRVALLLPLHCTGELLVPHEVEKLPPLKPDHPAGLKRFHLSGGEEQRFFLRA